jgi:hypothetical protein
MVWGGWRASEDNIVAMWNWHTVARDRKEWRGFYWKPRYATDCSAWGGGREEEEAYFLRLSRSFAVSCNVYYRVYNSPPLILILSQLILAHIIRSRFCETDFHLVSLLERLVAAGFHPTPCICTALVSHPCSMSWRDWLCLSGEGYK